MELAYLKFKILANISFLHCLLIPNFRKSLLLFNEAYYRGIYDIKLIYNIADTDQKVFIKVKIIRNENISIHMYKFLYEFCMNYLYEVYMNFLVHIFHRRIH